MSLQQGLTVEMLFLLELKHALPLGRVQPCKI